MSIGTDNGVPVRVEGGSTEVVEDRSVGFLSKHKQIAADNGVNDFEIRVEYEDGSSRTISDVSDPDMPENFEGIASTKIVRIKDAA